MRLTTDALIIRENNNIGEADRFVTALTRELGLVRAGRAANGYRRYGPAEVDRLQQVLLYREAEMPLADIKRLLDDPAFDARDALAGHLRELHARKERLDGLIASVEKTLASMEGDDPMKDEEKFEAFKQGLVD